MSTSEHQRQRRIWLSCTACRARKVKCDRARPCQRCTKAGVAGQCRYDLYTGSSTRETAPGQIVFAVQPAQEPERGQREVVAPPEIGPVAPLQLLWHGSRAVDQYVEPVRQRAMATPKEVVFGENDATVYWGRSHETNFVPRITDAAKLLLDADTEDDVSALYHIERSTRPGETVPVRAHDAGLRALLPPRDETDRCVAGYVEGGCGLEAWYKIVHVPTLLRDYARLWDPDPAVSSCGPPYLLAQLLSICAIASGMGGATTARAGQWIEAVRLWLFQQDPRSQMTLGHLQAQLLMLVAGDVHWIKIDRSWVAAGMLVRHAVSAGLHREPSDLTRVSPFYAELRRRLWYAILEFDLQAALAKGRTPAVRDDDYDCRPPRPVADRLLRESATEAQIQAAAEETSSIPLYVCLARSLALRMEVCRLVNGIRLTAGYDEVLRLDAALRGFRDQAAAAIRAEPSQRGLLSILTRRTTIALHAPFVARTLHDPRYLHSRRVCAETATALLGEALALPGGAFAAANNICRCEIANSVFLLCHELLTQAVERRRRRRRQITDQHQPQHVWVDLVERAARAVAVVAKPDIVSQRTCAWMQLSAELSRAAVGDDALTVISMKDAIGRSIQAYWASIQPPDSGSGGSYFLWSTGVENTIDEDYFNLFLNLNHVDGWTGFESGDVMHE